MGEINYSQFIFSLFVSKIMVATRRSKTAHKYAKLVHNDVPDDNDKVSVASSIAQEHRLAKQKAVEKASQRLHSALWVIACWSTVYFTDFFRVVIYSPEVDRFYFNMGLISNGIFLSIMFYLAVYLPLIKGLK